MSTKWEEISNLGYLQWYDCLFEVIEIFPEVFDVHEYSVSEIFHFINVFYKTSSLHATMYSRSPKNLKSEIPQSKQVPLWAELSLNTYSTMFFFKKTKRIWMSLGDYLLVRSSHCGLNSSLLIYARLVPMPDLRRHLSL